MIRIGEIVFICRNGQVLEINIVLNFTKLKVRRHDSCLSNSENFPLNTR
jgi:hypothetical protein